jgi:hypothetical protein
MKVEEIPQTAKFQNTIVGETDENPLKQCRSTLAHESRIYESTLDTNMDKNIKNSLVSLYKLTR